jgi:chromosome segregation ATPase
MGKLLRVSVVLLLLLALVASGLGYLLFQKRESLKGLTQDLAAEVVKTARFIESSQDPDLTKSENPKMDKEIEVTQLLTYKLDPNVVQADTNKPATMKQTMGLLQGKAEAQLSILTDTRAALAQKIQELDAATNKIASLEADIVRLEGEKKQLQDNVTVLEKEVAEGHHPRPERQDQDPGRHDQAPDGEAEPHRPRNRRLKHQWDEFPDLRDQGPDPAGQQGL